MAKKSTNSTTAEATAPLQDAELQQYRNLLEPPNEFKDGFGWTTIAGILFCGLVMLPGSIYLGLMTGGSMGTAATWVTVILFNEIARRALKSLSKQNLVVLLYAASAIMASSALFPGGPFGQMVFRAYLVTGDAIRDAGLRDMFPTWWAPKWDSPAITGRNFTHRDWIIPVALVVFMAIINLINKYTLGYFFFRLTSDVEQLPFPLAPIQAQGAMALAEADEPAPAVESGEEKAAEDLVAKKSGPRKKSDRWRLFSLGVVIGIVWGFLQAGVPIITGLMFDKPFYIVPQPYIDLTTTTEGFLPATPTGLVLDPGIVLLGMIIPFWAVIGSTLAIIATMVFNPLMHYFGVLNQWQPGMSTINTTYANSIDFWFSFGIGSGVAIAVVSIFQTIRDVRKKLRELKAERKDKAKEPRDLWATPKKGRGDYPLSIALIVYLIASAITVFVCYLLLPRNLGVLTFLIIFTFIYNPLISYVNARLLGISGQTVEIPFVRETAFILSGAQGVAIWLAPIPLENVGSQAQAFRVNELTGVSFWSLIKTDLVVLPIAFILSFAFWAFIWIAEPVPSATFPAAQQFWELQAKQTALLYSSTASGDIMSSQFMGAIHKGAIGTGFGLTVMLFVVLSTFGLPVMLVYGMIRGFGGLPHTMLLEIFGATLGRYYFHKKFGADNFLRMVPTILAGYYTGVGLIAMATVAMKLIQTAISSAPF